MTTIERKVDLDGRGMLGVYHIIEELGGLNQESHNQKIKQYICKRIRENIAGYPSDCDINEVAMTFNKLANHPQGFESEQKVIVEFIVEKFYPDFASGKTQNLRLQFKNFTTIFWGMSKVISNSKDLRLREKTIGFAEAFGL